MPEFDGTGPRGMGPMTGGSRGFCVAPLGVTSSELAFLKNDLNLMREQLAKIEARIEKLGNEKNKLQERSD